MLQAFRGKAASLVTKILFTLLILSFAVWGIGDIFRGGGGGSNVAAEVAGHPIDIGDVDRQFRTLVDQQRQRFPGLTLEIAETAGFKQMALQSLISDRLLDVYAAQLGYALTPEAAAAAIRRDPNFTDPATGQFSRQRFLAILAQSGYDEANYVRLIQVDGGRRAIIGAAATAAAVPDALAQQIYRWRRQTRDVELIELPASAQTVAAPTDADLQAYLDANPDSFKSQEYRDLSVIVMQPGPFIERTTVTPEEVRDYYADHQEEFTKPERRRLDQVIATTEDAAKAIAASLREGATPEAAIAASGDTGASLVPIDPTAKADMPLPALADQAFALEVGGVGDPVQSPFGWHVLVLREIVPAGVDPFESVSAGIEARLRDSKAMDDFFAQGSKLEDALADGAAPAEAAAEFGFTVVTVTDVASDGTTKSGAALPEGLPAPAVLMPVAFQEEEGGSSRMTAFDPSNTDASTAASFIVHVDKVTPPAVQPLDAVRNDVTAAWTHDAQAKAVETLAGTVRTRLDAGEDAATVAGEVGGTLSTATGLLRDMSNAGAVPTALIGPIFGLEVGKSATAPTITGQTVARLTKVTVPDPAADPDGIAAVKANLAGNITRDLTQEFTGALDATLGVTIDEDVLARLTYANAS